MWCNVYAHGPRTQNSCCIHHILPTNFSRFSACILSFLFIYCNIIYFLTITHTHIRSFTVFLMHVYYYFLFSAVYAFYICLIAPLKKKLSILFPKSSFLDYSLKHFSPYSTHSIRHPYTCSMLNNIDIPLFLPFNYPFCNYRIYFISQVSSYSKSLTIPCTCRL